MLTFFLGLDRLVQPVGPAAARHDAAGVLVDNDDLAVLHDVFDVSLVKRIGAEQLRQRMDVLGHHLVFLLGLALGGLLLLGGLGGLLLDVDEGGREVRQHERIGVVGTELLPAHLGEVGLVVLLIDDKEQLLLPLVELLLVEVGVHLDIRLVEELAPLRVFLEAEQQFVLRHAQLDLEHLHRGGMLVVSGGVLLLEQVRGLLHELVDETELGAHERLDAGLEAGERLLALDGCGAGDDQRGARLVDQDGVDLVHDAVEVVALDLVLLARGHAVVAQVVETELGGGAVGDVAGIHLATELGVHGLLDAADREAEEAVEVPHPLGVAAGEVVVDRDELGVLARERVEVEPAAWRRGSCPRPSPSRRCGPRGDRCRR